MKTRCLQPGEFERNREKGERFPDAIERRPDERSYRGNLVNDVPSVEPGPTCNARLHNNVYQFVAFCNEGVDGSRCERHSHEPRWPTEDLRINNQFATKHGLHSDPEKYYENMTDKTEKEEIEETKQSIIRKMERNNELEVVDRKVAERIATRLHIAEQASDYLQKTGLTQTVFTENGSHKKKNPVLSELRQYDASVVDDMRKYGILDDPETKKADALQQWREYIE